MMQKLKKRNIEGQTIFNLKKHITLKLTVETLTSSKELCISHFWFGLHHCNCDALNLKESSVQDGKRISEDTNLMTFTEEFISTTSGIFQGILVGLSSSSDNTSFRHTISFTISTHSETQHQIYFSYKALIIPNNTFLANKDKLAYPLFDQEGNFIGADFIIFSSEVIGEYLEMNNKSSANTMGLFLSKIPNTDTGINKENFISQHTGTHSMFANSNSTFSNYQIARIKIESVSVALQDSIF
ncbi:hypothetical protein BZZ01_03195 [Nostocales cyanobacterium HT-58-2]|nr:hypothetical protein BZZ01_03195 [Nostocales cyanobacterium HT-58-2]